MNERKVQAVCCFLLCVALFPSLGARGQEPRPWRVSDLYQQESFGAVTVAPSGSSAISIRNWIDLQTKIPRHALWFSWGDPLQSMALEAKQPDARNPVISPDGKWTFVDGPRGTQGSKRTLDPEDEGILGGTAKRLQNSGD